MEDILKKAAEAAKERGAEPIAENETPIENVQEEEKEEAVEQEEAQEEPQQEPVSEEPSEEPANEEEPEGFALEFTEDDFEAAPERPETYKPIAEALGIEGESIDDITAYVSELKQKAETPKTEFANDALAKANELAAQGQDWETYLKLHTIDYSTLSDKDAGIAVMRNQGFDEEKIQDLLEETSGETLILQQGRKAKQEAEYTRKQRLAQMEAEGQKQKQAAEETKAAQRKAQESLNRDIVDEVKRRAKDGYHGIKIPESYYNSLEQKLTTGQGVMSLFLDDSGKPDPSKIVDAVMQRDLFDKVIQRATTTSKNEGRRSVMESLHNTSLEGKPSGKATAQTKSKGMQAKDALLSKVKSNPFNTKKE